MLCESCKEREAVVHYTQVADGSVKKVHLCVECAEKMGINASSAVSMSEILLGLGYKGKGNEPDEDLSCPRCHMRRADFKKTGRLGCADCYQTFATDLAPLIKAMHHSEQHVGKVPAHEGIRARLSSEIAGLQKALDQAIATENYEEAARLRDRIQTCRQRAAEDEKRSEAP